MLATPTDLFIFAGIFFTFLLMVSVLARSPIMGAFAALLLILLGVYGLVNVRVLGFGQLNAPISFTLIGAGMYIMVEAYRAKW